MKNDSAKNLLIIVLLIIVLLLTIAVVYNVTTGESALDMFSANDKQDVEENKGISNDETNVVEETENEVKDKNKEDAQEDNIAETEDVKLENENEDEENIVQSQEKPITDDTQNNYDISKIKWSKLTQIKDNHEEDSKMNYFIESGKLKYYNLETNKEEVLEIVGTPKSLVMYISGGIVVVELLTEEGEIFRCEPFEGDSGHFGKKDICGYKVKDFAFLEDYAQGHMYYLLENDKVIDMFGLEYNTFQSSLGYLDLICFKEGSSNIWYMPDLTDSAEEYQVLKDAEGKKVEAKTVYWKDARAYEDEEYIIVTKDNKMLYYNISEQKIVKAENGEVVKVTVLDKDSGDVEFKFKDGSTVTVSRVLEQYIDVNTLQKGNLY